jgi:hypothetical protein
VDLTDRRAEAIDEVVYGDTLAVVVPQDGGAEAAKRLELEVADDGEHEEREQAGCGPQNDAAGEFFMFYPLLN